MVFRKRMGSNAMAAPEDSPEVQEPPPRATCLASGMISRKRVGVSLSDMSGPLALAGWAANGGGNNPDPAGAAVPASIRSLIIVSGF